MCIIHPCLPALFSLTDGIIIIIILPFLLSIICHWPTSLKLPFTWKVNGGIHQIITIRSTIDHKGAQWMLFFPIVKSIISCHSLPSTIDHKGAEWNLPCHAFHFWNQSNHHACLAPQVIRGSLNCVMPWLALLNSWCLNDEACLVMTSQTWNLGFKPLIIPSSWISWSCNNTTSFCASALRLLAGFVNFLLSG